MIPIKRGKEIDGMRRSCRLVAEVVDALRSILAPGIRTGEVDRYAADVIAARGGKSAFLGYRGFPGTICISVNDEVVHGIGGDRMLQYGDLVKLDVGVVKDGWVGDTAATFPIGTGEAGDLKLIEITRRALWEGIAQARAGNRIGDIGAAIEECVQAQGFEVVREFVGHGVGHKLHEEPQVPNYGRAGTGPRLKAGMTLAIEPMVNAGGAGVRVLSDGWTVVTNDGRRSAHFEHTVLVTGGEPEILTRHGSVATSEENGLAASTKGATSMTKDLSKEDQSARN